jgi:CMP-N,N'-diacetyllegionaminic acid synthase
MRIVGFVPARRGSKGLPLKHMRKLGEYTLIEWTFKSISESKSLFDSFVSTDCPEVTELAKKWDLNVIQRPENLARDESLISDVILHFLDKINFNPDGILLLQATNPFRGNNEIDYLINKFNQTNFNSMISVVESAYHPADLRIFQENKLKNITRTEIADNSQTNRQSRETTFFIDGGYYLTRTQDFIKTKSFENPETLWYFRNKLMGIDIDSEIDLMLANLIQTNYMDELQQSTGVFLNG